MTSLFSGTPEAAIWNRAEFGQVLDEAVRRPAQVVYSVVPSEGYVSMVDMVSIMVWEIFLTIVELDIGMKYDDQLYYQQ